MPRLRQDSDEYYYFHYFCKNEKDMMTVLEQRFMEVVPNILRDLVKAVEDLTKEVKELKEQQKKTQE